MYLVNVTRTSVESHLKEQPLFKDTFCVCLKGVSLRIQAPGQLTSFEDDFVCLVIASRGRFCYKEVCPLLKTSCPAENTSLN